MHRARTTSTVILTAVMATAPSAMAQTIIVTPSDPHAGQRIHISVPDCGTGPTPHTATSEAFTREVTLYGKADTGDADPTIRAGLKPGTYAITAHCGTDDTVRGQVMVAADDAQPAGRPAAGGRGGGSSTFSWAVALIAAIMAAGTGAFFLRRRRGGGRT